jgi:hypothetical protein
MTICKRHGDYAYLCKMKNEITIPVQVHDLKEEDVIAAVEHRKKYSTKRDLQALEFNQAIVTRLAREKEKKVAEQSEINITPTCEKCGNELTSSLFEKGISICSKCSK